MSNQDALYKSFKVDEASAPKLTNSDVLAKLVEMGVAPTVYVIDWKASEPKDGKVTITAEYEE